MSWPAAWTPFLTTDQKGSLAWPWLTTIMRVLPCCAVAGVAAASVRAAAAAKPVTNDFIGSSQSIVRAPEWVLPDPVTAAVAPQRFLGSRRGLTRTSAVHGFAPWTMRCAEGWMMEDGRVGRPTTLAQAFPLPVGRFKTECPYLLFA